MPASATAVKEGFVALPEDLQVWTPDGYRRVPEYIAQRKLLEPDGSIMVSKTMPQISRAAWLAGGRYPTSGEWRVARRWLEELNELVVESDMRDFEMTGTVIDFSRDRVYQLPEFDDEGNILTDIQGQLKFGPNGFPQIKLKAKDAWEMAVPKKSDFVAKLLPKFETFVRTLYGIENPEELPDYAYVLVPESGGISVVLCGGWSSHAYRIGRVFVDARWGPFDRRRDMTSRVVID